MSEDPSNETANNNNLNEDTARENFYDHNINDDKIIVVRNGKTFEKRLAGYKESTPSVPELLKMAHNKQKSFASRIMASIRGINLNDGDQSPDNDFCASTFMKLTHGITAYRLLEPALVPDELIDKLPLIVCLHGLTTASYMWADLSDLLMNCDHGPQCRVLCFDFYGHGRSPWNGVTVSLDLLVTQTKELLDVLGFTDKQVALIGYDYGCNIAVGFAAKYPDLCLSLSLISPTGIKYKPLEKEKMYRRKYVGEYLMIRSKKSFANQQLRDFYNFDRSTIFYPYIRKHVTMVQWQIDNTPGYLGCILSAYRHFPLKGMEELFSAVGRYPRKVQIFWGKNDAICPFKKCINRIEECFPNAEVIDIDEAGHQLLVEKFDNVASEILGFHKKLFEEKFNNDIVVDDFGI
eukprot:gene17088-22601_t